MLGVEAVELREELIQGLLALVVAAHERADPARLPQRIQLVDEDDARGLLLGLGEEVADARGSHADEHLHEVRAAQAEERHAGLPRDGLGQQGLPGAGGADDEHPFGDLPTEAPVAIGVLEEVHDLHQLASRLVDARDVVEGDPGGVLDVDPGLALADRHEPLLRAEAAHDEDPHPREHHGGKDPGEEGREPEILHVPGELDVRLLELGHEPGILDPRRDEAVRSSTQPLQLLELLRRKQGLEPVGRERAADGFFVEGEIADLALLRERLELAVRDVGGPRPKERELKYENGHEGDREIANRELPLFEVHDRGPLCRLRRDGFRRCLRVLLHDSVEDPPACILPPEALGLLEQAEPPLSRGRGIFRENSLQAQQGRRRRERRLDAVTRHDPASLVIELHEPLHFRPPHAGPLPTPDLGPRRLLYDWNSTPDQFRQCVLA